jgi:hypothetical protein
MSTVPCYSGGGCLMYNSSVLVTQGASSSFMDKYGSMIGWIILSIWIILTIIGFIYIHKSKKIDKKYKKNYYIGPILLSILVVADIIYYIIASHSKSHDRNLIFVNVALIPIYLILALLLLLLIGMSNH